METDLVPDQGCSSCRNSQMLVGEAKPVKGGPGGDAPMNGLQKD